MVIPEKVTPSGVKLSDKKIHCGLGFEKMFDVFVYDGADREETYNKMFISPKQLDENETVLVDSDITDKYRLSKITSKGHLVYDLDSYGIVLVTDGKGSIGEIKVKVGDRLFVAENEGRLDIDGTLTVLLCRP